MLETRLLRRVIHYIWECYRERGDIRIRLQNDKGDELHVEEQVDAFKVVMRYFVKQPRGELVKQIEVVCCILQHGEWIPLALGHEGDEVAFATANPDTGHVDVFDRQGQVDAASFCDAWAFHLLEEGFLASAAKLYPLRMKPVQRPKWPQPTVPAPSLEQIEEWMWEDGGCEATDGTWVEVDGISPHGHPSWLLRLSLI